MKLSAPVSLIFLLQPCRAYRHDLDETGRFIAAVGLNQHPLRISACRTILKTGHKIPCQKSQVGRAKRKKAPSRNQFTSLDRRRWLTEDNRNRKRSRAPCPVGLNQHVLGPAPGYDVRNGANDETEPKPRDAGRASAARQGRRQRVLAATGERKEESQRSPLAEDPASEKSSPAVDRAVGGHRYPAMQRSDNPSRGRPYDHHFHRLA